MGEGADEGVSPEWDFGWMFWSLSWKRRSGFPLTLILSHQVRGKKRKRWDPHAIRYWGGEKEEGKSVQDDRLKTPSPPKNGIPPRRGIVMFIPPLRGDSGGVHFSFCFDHYLLISVFSG